jgi:uncharacterized protein involved in exopolysaccharide biosynthesis
MIFEPGEFEVVDLNGSVGRRIYTDSPENIKSLIDAGTFNGQILNQFEKEKGKKQFPENLKFKTRISKNSNLLTVSYLTSDVDLGEKILEYLLESLIQQYEPIMEQSLKSFDAEIKSTMGDIDDLEGNESEIKNGISIMQFQNSESLKDINNRTALVVAKIKAKSDQISAYQKQITEALVEIEHVIKNKEELIRERKKNMAKMDNESMLTSILYSTIIQQNRNSLNDLNTLTNQINSQIFEIRQQIEDLKIEISELETQKNIFSYQSRRNIDTLQSKLAGIELKRNALVERLQLLKIKKASVKSIQIHKPPEGSRKPIRPRILMNVVLACFFGIFLMILLSFFIEYIAKYRNEESG